MIFIIFICLIIKVLKSVTYFTTLAYSAFLCVFFLELMWCDNKWEYVRCLNISYIWWLTICIGFVLLSICYKLFSILVSFHPSVPDSVNGFSLDEPLNEVVLNSVDKDLTSKVRVQMAEDVVLRLLSTNTDEDSFAVCVTGSWGSGKTSFMNYLHSNIEKLGSPNNVILFNPWNCSSSTQIISVFFEELLKLSLDSHKIEKALSSYAKSLIKTESSSSIWSPFIGLLETFDQNSQYDKIKEQLRHIHNKRFVLIDDIDRLDEDEILAVLKLIRNTANFPNIIYIVAFDKSYISKHISSSNTADGFSYLEKIFQLEIPLPRIDNIDIVELIREELRHNIQNLSVKQIEGIITSISNTEEKLKLLKIVFTNFRIAKRLVRQFSVVADYLIKTLHEKEFNLGDLFYLEILRYLNPQIYSLLSCSPEKILVLKYNEFSGNYWSLKDNYRNINEVEFSEEENSILKFLFSDERRMCLDRLAIRANYFNFFSLSQPRDSIRISEFKDVLNNMTKDYTILDNAIKGWCRSFVTKWNSTDSLYHCFNSCFERSKKYSFAEIQPYLYFSLYWVFYASAYSEYQVTVLTILLSKKIYASSVEVDLAINYFNENIQRIFKQKDIDILHFTWILSHLYRFDNVYHKQLLENNQIESLICNDCFQVLLEKNYKNKTCNAQELLQPTKPLAKFCLNAVVQVPKA